VYPEEWLKSTALIMIRMTTNPYNKLAHSGLVESGRKPSLNSLSKLEYSKYIRIILG
jgi:hypothetical protein